MLHFWSIDQKIFTHILDLETLDQICNQLYQKKEYSQNTGSVNTNKGSKLAGYRKPAL